MPSLRPSHRVLAASTPLEAWVIDTADKTDLTPILLDKLGRLKVVPSALLQGTTREQRLRFGVIHGFYGFLTEELMNWLREFIDGRTAIEIGAGHGQLAAALGIPATDNRQQEQPDVRDYYRALGQPTVRYGDNVQRLEAMEAIDHHKPEVVVASWVTHRYSAARPRAGGSSSGIDEEAVIRSCDAYVLIGNSHVHRHKPIWSLPHELLTPPWLYSRAINGSPDFIAIWRRTNCI
jgi:hypothetical protein